jgi:hypothetical protein
MIDISIIDHMCRIENSTRCRQQPFRSCSLADEDLHGYGIMRQVAKQTCGRVRLGPGTLYGLSRRYLKKNSSKKSIRVTMRPMAVNVADTTR